MQMQATQLKKTQTISYHKSISSLEKSRMETLKSLFIQGKITSKQILLFF